MNSFIVHFISLVFVVFCTPLYEPSYFVNEVYCLFYFKLKLVPQLNKVSSTLRENYTEIQNVHIVFTRNIVTKS